MSESTTKVGGWVQLQFSFNMITVDGDIVDKEDVLCIMYDTDFLMAKKVARALHESYNTTSVGDYSVCYTVMGKYSIEIVDKGKGVLVAQFRVSERFGETRAEKVKRIAILMSVADNLSLLLGDEVGNKSKAWNILGDVITFVLTG